MGTGMAKPRPWLPPDWLTMKVLIPTRTPSAFTSGPPLLPGLMGASVWMSSMGVGRGVTASIWRAEEETTPMVTVLASPCGLPTAKTSSPCRTLAVGSRARVGRPVASMRSRARSMLAWVPTTRAS